MLVNGALGCTPMYPRTEPPFRADHVGQPAAPALAGAGPPRLRGRPDRRRPPARGRGRGDPRRRRPAGGHRPAHGHRRGVPPHVVAHGLHLPARRCRPDRRGTRRAVPQRRGHRSVHRRRSGCPRAAAPRRADLHRRLPVPVRAGTHGDAEDDPAVAEHGAPPERHRRRRPNRLPRPRPVLGRPRPPPTPTRSGPSPRWAAATCSSTTPASPASTIPSQRAHLAERGDDAEHTHERNIRTINAAVADRPDGNAHRRPHVPGQLPLVLDRRGRLRLRRGGAVRRARRRRLLLRVRRRALGRVRPAALRAARQAGRPRAGDHEARAPRGPRRAQAPDRRGRQVRPARPALPLPAVRVLLDRRGQRAQPPPGGRQAAAGRRRSPQDVWG